MEMGQGREKWPGGAQRPILHGNENKKFARSARARSVAKNLLVYKLYNLAHLQLKFRIRQNNGFSFAGVTEKDGNCDSQ